MQYEGERETPGARPRARGEVKDGRLEARVPVELKTMFQKAAYREGVTLTDYVISAPVEKSRTTIRDRGHRRCTQRRGRRLLQSDRLHAAAGAGAADVPAPREPAALFETDRAGRATYPAAAR
ncbi:MAG: DUF1778 domain-containing protein [Dongia sp.]